MNIKINIITTSKCDILVLDVTQYLPEKSEHKEGFLKKSETVSLAILLEVTQEQDFLIDYMLGDEDGIFKLNPKKDGYFRITVAILPDKAYFQELLNNGLVNTSIINYYSDGVLIYKYSKSKSTVVPIEELASVNLFATNIEHAEQDIVSLCRLKKCYIQLCRKSINKIDRCSNDIEDNFNRDLALMTINVINYLVDFNQDEDAGKILKLIEGCHGICESGNHMSDKNECGCS